jgi:uncharacterized protein YbbC (DUF1343 family)
MRTHSLWVLGVLACARTAPAPLGAQVRPGIDVLLSDSIHLVRGRRLGLLTNQTGVDRRGRRDVDVLLAAGLRVVALFSPEHGFRGVEDRPGLPDAVDSATGLPIYSLYGGSRASATAALDSLDVLLIDLQDIGARYYTYPATAASLLRSAAARGKRVLVLDRPDPIGGGMVQGNVRAGIGDPDSELVSFLPVPMRHGMTLGELLRLANDRLGLHADLVVVPVAGWRRDMAYDATGLPWVQPSPNMPDLESAFHYPGLCLFEATNLSVGRGTPRAFQVVGAPWLEPAVLLEDLRREAPAALAGVSVTVDSFTPRAPTDGKYDGVLLRALRFRVTDRTRYDPTRLALALLVALARTDSTHFELRARGFDRLAGGPELRLALVAGHPAAEVWRGWQTALTAFRRTRSKYLVY